MFWSQTTIPDKASTLVVDGSQNVQGWEAEFCDRLFTVFGRKGMHLFGDSPLRVERPDDLSHAIYDQETFNCIFLIGHDGNSELPETSKLRSFWGWLSSNEDLTPKLLAVCTCDGYDPETSQLILSAEGTFAQLAVVQQSPLSPRAAGLFFMKFFSELNDHTADAITGKMVWFSYSKAREILRRRRLSGELGMRC